MSRKSLSVGQVAAIQVGVAIVALGAGGAVGWMLGRDALRGVVREQLGMEPGQLLERYRDLQERYGELFERCDPLEGSERDRLIEAQERVENLRGEIEQKEAEIASLEVRARENASLRDELEKRKRELSSLESALQTAEQQREELVEKLKTAIKEVSVAREQTRVARREVLSVRWEDFVSDAQLNICERGTRRRLDKCHDAVEAAFTPDRERRYRECVRTQQAVPELHEAERGQDDLPAFAEWVDEDSRFTRGWYILFCDPTLPEAGEGGLPEQDEAESRVGESDPAEAMGREDAFMENLTDEEDY